MCLDINPPAQDFELRLGMCINSMCQDDALGQTLGFERGGGALHMHDINPFDLVDMDIDRYELVIFDGGNTSGDCWKHVFFTRQRIHFYVDERWPLPPFQ